MKMNFSNQTVLITGGTGSFGRAFTKWMIEKGKPKKLIVFSRDELKQSEMAKEFHYDGLRFFIGDVRDRDRLYRAFQGVDIVVHAAALKQVPTLEYNPFEAVLTNIIGAENVIAAAIDRDVKKVVALSTDKAVNPVNLYGATKLCAEKLFIAANAYSKLDGTRFGVVRYGNVISSRGSVIPLFLTQKETGVLTITDPRMTRFWLTLDRAVGLVLDALHYMHGGEIFIPKVSTMSIIDLAQAVAPECEHKFIGIRPGEKLHEILMTEDEVQRAYDLDDCYSVLPAFDVHKGHEGIMKNGKKVPKDFSYSSDSETNKISAVEMKAFLNEKQDSIAAEIV